MVPNAASPDFPCSTCEVRDEAICAALADDELRHLNAISTSVELRAGQTVFDQGEKDAYLFNVVRGAVRLSKLLPDGRRQVTGFLFPGDLLGLTVSGEYAYAAEAMTDTSLCRFNRASFAELSDRFPKLEHRLISLASNELVQAQEHLLVLGRKTAAERVATILIRLLERIGHATIDGGFIELPMSREDLADYAGLTVETVSRVMSQLRKDGTVIMPTARYVEIPNKQVVMQLSGDY